VEVQLRSMFNKTTDIEKMHYY